MEIKYSWFELLIILFMGMILTLSVGCGQPTHQSQSPQKTEISSTEKAKSPDELMEEANQLLMEDKMPEAIAKLQEVVKADPDRTDAYIELARAYRFGDNPDYAKALENLEKILEKDDKNKSAWQEKAVTYSLMQDKKKSIQAYHKLIELGEENAGIYQSIASNYEDLKQFDKAEEYFNKAIEKYPQEIMPLSQLGEYFRRRSAVETDNTKKAELYQKSADQFQKAFDIAKPHDPMDDQPGLLYQVGSAYMDKWNYTQKEEDRKKAEDCFRKFIEIKPDHPWNSSAQENLKTLNKK